MPTIQRVVVGSADQAGTITCSVQVDAGDNLFLLAAVHIETWNDDCSAMSRDGQSLTEHDFVNASTWSRVEFWKLINPNVGTTTLTATVAGPGADRARLAVWVLEGVDQTTPLRDAATDFGDTGLSNSLDALSSDVTDLIIDALTIDSTGHAADTGSVQQTEEYGVSNGISGSFEMYGSWKNGEDGDVMDWSWSVSNPWSHIAVAVVAAAAITQKLRPDADLATTGWNTAPLWSKIEEETADGTVITGVAS